MDWECIWEEETKESLRNFSKEAFTNLSLEIL
jgi:hypothetical protein